MKAAQSCGLLLRARGRYLLCRATGTALWTVPKGLAEAGERPQAAAVRETREETGLLVDEARVPDEPFAVFFVGRKARRKEVLVFFVEDDALADCALHCSSLIEGDTVPQALVGLPEVDDFAWLDWKEAHNRAFESQKRGIFALQEPERQA